MKTNDWNQNLCRWLAVFAVMVGAKVVAATPDELVAEGRVFLANSNLISAQASFDRALAASPQHAPANVLAGITRLLSLPQQPAVSNALTWLGVAPTGRNMFDWTADFIDDLGDRIVLPSAPASSESATLIRDEVMPAIRSSITNLSRVTSRDFKLELSTRETQAEAVTLDYGQVQLLRSLLRAAGAILSGTLDRTAPTTGERHSVFLNNGSFSFSRYDFSPEPPVILSQPQDQTIEAGKAATLTVTASGHALRYQWFSNDMPIRGATARALTRKSPGAAQVEAYSVAVFNSIGAVTSRVASVTVMPNPFPEARGTYNGLFGEEDAIRHEHAGSFTATTTDRGAFSGRLNLAGRNISFHGKFDPNGRATNSVAVGTNALLLGLQLDLNSNGTRQITGIIASVDGAWTANLLADRAYFHPTLRPTDLAGPYTLVIPGAEDDSGAPGRASSGTVFVTKGGVVTLRATLADGARVSQKTSLSQNGQWPLFAPLYSGKGSILGRMAFDGSATNLSGQVTWTRPALLKSPISTSGFVLVTNAVGFPKQTL